MLSADYLIDSLAAAAVTTAMVARDNVGTTAQQQHGSRASNL